MDVHSLALHARVAHAGIPDACPPALVVDASAAFGPEQELVLALSGGLLLQLGNERLRQGDGPRLTVFCVPSCILPSSSSDHVRRMRALSVPEVEILNLQSEHFVDAHAGVGEESHQQFDFRHGEEHHVLVLGHNLRYGDQLGRVLRIHLLVMAYSNTAAMTTLTMLCRDSAAAASSCRTAGPYTRPWRVCSPMIGVRWV